MADATFALRLSVALAKGAWDDWVPGKVPFAIVYPDEQWLFRASAPLPGYMEPSVATSLGPAWRAPSWTRYDGVRVPFSPSQFFAQADKEGNALSFTIAAPRVAPFPPSDWATIFAHEYFHTFQMTDPRWAADASLTSPSLRRTLAGRYETDSRVRASVDRELQWYADRLRVHEGFRCDALEEAARVREERSALLGAIDPALPRAERAFERFEGVARYVEEKAYDLEEVARVFESREPGWKPASPEESLKRRLGVVGGEYFYATGYALARLLDGCNPSWKRQLAGKDLLELARKP